MVKRFKYFVVPLVLLAVVFLIANTAQADSGPVITRNVGPHLCGYLSRRWSLGTMVSGTFRTIAEQTQLIKEELENKHTRRSRRLELNRQLDALNLIVENYGNQCPPRSAPRSWLPVSDPPFGLQGGYR